MTGKFKAPLISQILTEARALISTPNKWTTGVYARNAAGNETNLSYEHAVCFCAKGAIVRVIRGYYSQSDDARSRVQEEIGLITNS